MCVTPPYDRQQYRSRLTAGLLSELTTDRLDRLLALISRWITDVRAHSAEPETTTQT